MSATQFIALLAATITAPAIFGDTCESLSKLALPDTTVTRAETVEAGAFTAPSAPPAQQASFKSLQALCRIAAELNPHISHTVRHGSIASPEPVFPQAMSSVVFWEGLLGRVGL